MKCTNCGHELEPGSGFCRHCGMIMSLDEPQNEKENSNQGADDSFGYIEQNQPETQEEASPAVESEKTEEPAALDDETAEAVFEDISSGVPFRDEPENAQQENTPEQNASVFEDGETRALFQSETEGDENSLPLQPTEQSDSSTVSLPEENETEDDESDEDFDEMLVSPKRKGKKGSVIVAVLVVVLVAVIAGGVTVIRGNFSAPVNASTTQTTTAQDANAVDPTTKKEETTKEETTEKETTEKEKTTKEEKTTKDEKATTKAEATSASRPGSASTSAARTTAATTRGTTRPYSTSKAQTTSRAQTTRAQTTTKRASTTARPATTNSPSTSNRYDVVSVKPQKPSSYLSNSYTGYVTVNGVHMRSGPSASSSHILYFSIGADVKVLASQNGFLYVYSNRYGVYGWINAANVSKTRPQSSSETTVPNLVKPDKTYSSQKTMYVNTKAGLRLRKGPGSSYDVIRMLSNGYPVTVKGYSSANSGWVYVTDTTHGVSGWVSSAYLK